MADTPIALTAWSFALAGAAYAAFAVRLVQLGYLGSAGRRVGRYLLFAVAACSAWGWLSLADQFSRTLLLQNLAAFADLLAYGLWFVFLLHLIPRSQDGSVSVGVRWLTPLAALLFLAALLVRSAAAGVGGLDSASRPALLVSLALSVLALVLVEQLLRGLNDDELWNAKPLCLGLAGYFLFDLYRYSQAMLFNSLDTDALSILGAVRALMVPLLMLSIARRRDWVSTLRVSRKAAFHSATLLLAGAYLLFISAVGYYVRFFGGEWGRALQLGLIVIALVVLGVLAVSGAMRARLRVFLGKHFFRYRYDYREEWLRFTQTLSAQNSPQEMGMQVIRGLADLLESPGGGLWLKGARESVFRQVARWNMPASSEPEEESGSLCQFMAYKSWVINLEEYRSVPRRYDQLSLPPWLLNLPQAWLIVPLCVGEQLIGFVVLNSARTPMDVNWEVNDLLKTAGRQAASFLAQMQATEALLEVRKFDAFNRMSAFVVHDLKNIVTQLSLMMKNAKRLHANPEFQQDMLMTVENSLDRMRQLMLQLREGATPPGTAFGVELTNVVRRIEADVAGRGRHLEVDLAEKAEKLVARGHEDRLERVIGHVVHNALDATDPGGRVWLKIERSGGSVRIEVGDTGHGMTPEFVRDRLFKPFHSTKQAGMGIGAYESFQYVKELGGNITVESEPGRGTQVSMLLPLFETHDDSELQMLKAS